MQKVQQLLAYIPYLYLIAIYSFWFYDGLASPARNFNTIAFSFTLFAFLQLFLRKPLLNLILGVISSCIGLWLLLAVFSDFAHVSSITKGIINEVVYGGSLAAATISMGGLLIYHFATHSNGRITFLSFFLSIAISVVWCGGILGLTYLGKAA